MRFVDAYVEDGETDVRIPQVERVVRCLSAVTGERIRTHDGRTVRVLRTCFQFDPPEYEVRDLVTGRESVEFGHAWIAGRVVAA